MIGGELVREARKRAAMTQRQLAERAGTTQSSIARLESGRTSPALEEVLRLIRLTGFDLRVELVPYDDSDLLQATADANPGARLDRLISVSNRMRHLRDEVRHAG